MHFMGAIWIMLSGERRRFNIGRVSNGDASCRTIYDVASLSLCGLSDTRENASFHGKWEIGASPLGRGALSNHIVRLPDPDARLTAICHQGWLPSGRLGRAVGWLVGRLVYKETFNVNSSLHTDRWGWGRIQKP